MDTGITGECPLTIDEPPLLSQPRAAAPRDEEKDASFPSRLEKTNPKWNDWKWQVRNRIRSIGALKECFPSIDLSADLIQVADKYPLAITPYYASLIKRMDDLDPIYRMSVPQGHELSDPPFLRADPLEEENDMPVPGLIHRYRDRALVMATTMCSMYCRHCTRKRVAGTREVTISAFRIRQTHDYLVQHPEIKDVIISGGDPLTMDTPTLERLLEAIRSVPSVELIRIGTRTPVVLPMRITSELTTMLKKFQPIWINTHFNHPQELTPEAIAACGALVDAGIPMGNQTVLLRGVNDDPELMAQLCRGLLRSRVKPYYLFQCDLVRGVEHFRTPLTKGLEIMEYLRGRVSGLAIPTFVVDTPHGGGKVPLLPNYIVSTSPTHTVLRNFEGMMMSYPEPQYRTEAEAAPVSDCGAARGVWQVANGRVSALVPGGCERTARRARMQTRKPLSDV
jgi:lysine 2,3-aminomutase